MSRHETDASPDVSNTGKLIQRIDSTGDGRSEQPNGIEVSSNNKMPPGFPGVAVVGSPPDSAGDTGPGGSHMPRSS